MRNSDMPAMPYSNAVNTEFGPRGRSRQGLTKREHFAAMALQGLLSGVNGDCEIHSTAEEWVSDIAASSVEFADALLAELEKTDA